MSHQNPTDKELIELAAKAAGIEGEWQRDTNFVQERYRFDVPYNNQGMMTSLEWNPLREDGDALRLAVKLQLEIRPGPGAVSVSNVCYGDPLSFVWYDGDPYKATRRAIVMAAAKIAKINEEGECDD